MKFAYLFDTNLQERELLDPKNPQIEILFVQTPMMSKNYQMYHDILFMDATYNTNQLNLALTVLTGISSEGKNLILGFAFMARETTENYQWMLR